MEYHIPTKRRGSAALSILLAAALTAGSGCCTQLHHLPDECATAVYECDLARLIHNVCSCEPLPDGACRVECGSSVPCGCGSVVEEFCYEEPSCPGPTCPLVATRGRIEVGPPPVTYKPLMPPKFLPVPSQPVFSQVNMLAEPSVLSPVEVDFDHQLTFPGQ